MMYLKIRVKIVLFSEGFWVFFCCSVRKEGVEKKNTLMTPIKIKSYLKFTCFGNFLKEHLGRRQIVFGTP